MMARSNTYVYFRTISTLFLLFISYTLCAFCKDNDTEYLDAGFTVTQPNGTCTYFFGTGYIKQDGLQYAVSPGQTPVQSPLQYFYYTKDHLGNIRSVVTKNPSTNAVTEVQRTHYYPYGGIIADISTGQNTQPRLYSSKELDMMHGLRWHDHGARFADNTILRWTTMDPLCEKYYDTSPYVFCGDNPLKYVDPNGRIKHDWINKSSKGYNRLRVDISSFEDNPNVVNIWAHGYEHGIEMNTQIISTSQKFIEKIKNLSEYRESKGENLIIVLHSCKTAEFAKKISKDSFFTKHNITIVAPTENITVETQNSKLYSNIFEYLIKFITGQNLYEESYKATEVKTLIDESTKTYKKGQWNAYKNGEVIKSYPYNSKPGSKDFNYDIQE